MVLQPIHEQTVRLRRRPESPASSTAPDTRPDEAMLSKDTPARKKPEYVPGELVVKLDSDTSRSAIRSIRQQTGIRALKEIALPALMEKKIGGKLYHAKLATGVSVEEAISRTVGQPGVQYAEPNYRYRLIEPVGKRPLQGPIPAPPPKSQDQNIPNDPLFPQMWHLQNTGQTGGTPGADIRAAEAWAVTTGGKAPLTADIDTGVAYTNTDLVDNLWTNPEDGTHGRNVINDTNDPMDDHGHGTFTASEMGAVGNNNDGIPGVSWTADVVAVKFLDGGGGGTLADAVKAVAWATEKGARITSNSWGGGGFSQALYDVFGASPALHVCAAGNDGSDSDQYPMYPAAYDLPNIVSVAASDHKDELADFSNYGKTSVDLASPGVNVLGALPGDKYELWDGTSMATPLVTGAVRLILARFPDLTNDQIKDRLINTVDPVPAFEGKMVSGGRLNLYNALQEDNVPPNAPSDFQPAESGALHATLGWTATGDDGDVGQASRYDLRMSEKPIVDGAAGEGQVSFSDAARVPAPRPQPAGSSESVRVSLPPSTAPKTYYFALKVADKLGNRSGMVTTEATAPAATSVFEVDPNKNDKRKWSKVQRPWTKVNVADHGKVWSVTKNGSYQNNLDISLITVPIKLQTIKSPVLSFTEKHDTEKNYDFGTVEVSEDRGKTWKRHLKMDGFSDWKTQVVDLSRYEGKTIKVRFRFTSDSSVTQGGWFIQHLLISGEPKETAASPSKN